MDQDMWRMEKWLELAQATLQSQRTVPTNMEQLEDAIQDHREFLLELDSHKSLMMSINVIGSHLCEHSMDPAKVEKMNARLTAINKSWDETCEAATNWQTKLQTALLEVTFVKRITSLRLQLQEHTFSIFQTECGIPSHN